MMARPAEPSAEEAPVEEVAYRAALDAAIRSLGHREHGRRELERKLRSKGHAPLLVERVLDYLEDHDLQSDDRFADSFVRSRVQKGYGPIKIRQELASRGVHEDALERQLTEPADYWLDIARQAVERRFRRTPDRSASSADGEDSDGDSDDDPDGVETTDAGRRDAWNARARFLARRGFPADLIYRALGPERD